MEALRKEAPPFCYKEAIPDGCETVQIPGSLWAQFICRGPLPDSLQSGNTKIWSEWLPSLKGYELAGNYNLEFDRPPEENPADNVNYIWVPLKNMIGRGGGALCAWPFHFQDIYGAA